ncbi:MAG: hypothetical protein ACI86H_000763 [bacterium]|jgi:hypothetical protein
MKALKYIIIAVLVLNGGYSLYKWVAGPDLAKMSKTQKVAYKSQAAKDGLDLKKLTALAKKIRSGQELERKINEKGGINNLDLNADNKVDYIHVTEFGNTSKKIGYSLTIQPKKGQTQEIASITVEKNKNKAEIQVTGNEQLYGSDAIYNDSTTIERSASEKRYSSSSYGSSYHSSYFFYRPLWISPYSYGYYPGFYSSRTVVSPVMYRSQTTGYNSSTVRSGQSSFQQNSGSTITNPNRGKVASQGIQRSLQKPTSTQKQFQATSRSATRSGGFGRSSTGSTGSTSSTGSLRSGGFGKSSSSSSSYGRSLSSYSRSSQSRSVSSRSGGFSSRSFSSFGK